MPTLWQSGLVQSTLHALRIALLVLRALLVGEGRPQAGHPGGDVGAVLGALLVGAGRPVGDHPGGVGGTLCHAGARRLEVQQPRGDLGAVLRVLLGGDVRPPLGASLMETARPAARERERVC